MKVRDIRDIVKNLNDNTEIEFRSIKEKFELITIHGAKCNQCHKNMYLLKPILSTINELNDGETAKHTNLFYVCFGCEIITQIGYGVIDKDFQEKEANNELPIL